MPRHTTHQPWTTPRSPTAWTRSRPCSSSSRPTPYTARAYRRAAETIRGAALPVAELVRAGRARDLRGIGPGIEARLRELVETGQIAELAELERELAPDLVGLGRYLGLSAKRSVQLARVARRPHRRRSCARRLTTGRLRERAGDRAQDRGAAARGAGARAGAATAARACCSTGPASSSAGSRRRSTARSPATCAGGATPASGWRWSAPRLTRDRCSQRFAALPQIVAVIERDERRAVGVTIEGVPVELVVAEPDRVRDRAGARDRLAGVRRGARAAARRARRAGRVRGAEAPLVPAGAARAAVSTARRRRWCDAGQIRGDLHCHTTWSDGRAASRRWAAPPASAAIEYLAICDHTPAVGAVRGLTPDDVRRQGEEIAAANEALAPFRVLRGIECDILPDGRLDLPDDVLAELDWVQASVHGGQRMPRARDDQARRGGAAQPVRALPQPPDRALHQPPARERARPRAHLRGRARKSESRSRSTGSPTVST